MLFFRKLSLLSLVWLVFNAAQAEDLTEQLFNEVKTRLYQVRVINNKTGKKSSFGSGFVVFKDNMLASNYHVVSSFIAEPDKYTIEYASVEGDVGTLKIVDVDIINDLALLVADTPLGQPLEIDTNTAKGEKIFSLGNPLDLGFVIIEGIGNDKRSHSDDQRILYSASLNPGMSGGPAVNQHAELVGVNVATSRRGKNISFLVDVEALVSFYQQIPIDKVASAASVDALENTIKKQLAIFSHQLFKTIMAADWDTFKIDNRVGIHQLNEMFSCWDNSKDNDKWLFSITSVQCHNNHSIYITPNNYAGFVSYSTSVIKTKAPMLSSKFYQHYQSQYSVASVFGRDENEFANVDCYSDFVNKAQKLYKMTVCEQPLKRFKGLANFSLVLADISEQNEGFVFKLSVSGLRLNDSLQLAEKMVAEL